MWEPEEEGKFKTKRAAAGFGLHSGEDKEDDISSSLTKYLVPHPSSTFYFWMQEEAMFPLVKKGDLVLVDRSLEVKNEDLVIASYKGQHLLRRIVLNGSTMILKPESVKSRSLHILEPDDCIIFGVVTFVIHPEQQRNKKK